MTPRRLHWTLGAVACAAVAADFRGVGRLDIVTNNFNDQPYYFKNQLPRRNYVQFRLRGTKSNRDAVGAVVRLYQGKQVMTRQVTGACGYLSYPSHTLHFGLADHPAVDRVEIAWPSGIRQTLDHPDINTLHAVVEPAE
jgi:enediyne biosynthesis protein E4